MTGDPRTRAAAFRRVLIMGLRRAQMNGDQEALEIADAALDAAIGGRWSSMAKELGIATHGGAAPGSEDLSIRDDLLRHLRNTVPRYRDAPADRAATLLLGDLAEWRREGRDGETDPGLTFRALELGGWTMPKTPRRIAQIWGEIQV